MIRIVKGDLFSHKPLDPAKVSLLVHACNCRGSWGAGVAAVFKKKFPSTFAEHVDYCQQFASNSAQLLGTAQLIPALPTDPGSKSVGQTYVVCLFTSDYFGRKKLSPQEIARHTDSAMTDLQRQLAGLRENVNFDENDGKIVLNMPKINAGLFGVPWELTEEVLARYDFDVNVYVLE